MRGRLEICLLTTLRLPIIGTFIDVENRRRKVEWAVDARAIHLALRHAKRVQMFE